MGNKQARAAASAARKEEEDYWWKQLEINLSPIKSCEEFCERFKVKPEQYEGSKKMFYDGIAKGVPENKGKPFMMRETWLADAPHTEAAQKWVLNIWECFDYDHNNQLSLDEWLVFDGIRKYGSLEQRVMGSFVLFDHSRDHKIQRAEIEDMMRTAVYVSGVGLTEAMIQKALKNIMEIADSDGSGTLELSEAIKAAQMDPAIAKIFNCV